eukprot:TRINITY_DN28080_c0_g1_i1.p1 TRINITY_DN28080_c0_g1~~TRINITY_DN28080_c0_g1_i1.p1  ORF type:complete len:183 (+),score=30.95 TRINITY_DN28080_c0_g1_i1:68-616(+)
MAAEPVRSRTLLLEQRRRERSYGFEEKFVRARPQTQASHFVPLRELVSPECPFAGPELPPVCLPKKVVLPVSAKISAMPPPPTAEAMPKISHGRKGDRFLDLLKKELHQTAVPLATQQLQEDRECTAPMFSSFSADMTFHPQLSKCLRSFRSEQLSADLPPASASAGASRGRRKTHARPEWQ